MRSLNLAISLALAGVVAVGAGSASAQDCTHKIGAVLSLTGAYGAFGVPISKAAQLAVEQVDEARKQAGVGCALTYEVRDSQTQPSVAVDAARKMIDLEGITALVGPISSGITAPLLTSVTVEKDVLVIATASTSSSFTNMGREGKTKGLFFRTLPADSLQAVATAKMAWDEGMRRPAIVYLNNDWGQNNKAEFIRAFKALGGEIATEVAFNPDQPSYRAEINQAIDSKPDSLYLLSQPQDGSKQFREWVRFGGPEKYIFPQGMNDSAFVETVGEDLVKDGWFISPGTPDTPSIDTMEKTMQERWELSATGPGRASGYDAAALIALAMVAADIDKADVKGPTLAKYVRQITGTEGEPFYAGVEGFKAGIEMLKEGKKVRYVGATGPIQFDQYGDVAVPFVAQKFEGGAFRDKKAITLEDVAKVKALSDKTN